MVISWVQSFGGLEVGFPMFPTPRRRETSPIFTASAAVLHARMLRMSSRSLMDMAPAPASSCFAVDSEAVKGHENQHSCSEQGSDTKRINGSPHPVPPPKKLCLTLHHQHMYHAWSISRSPIGWHMLCQNPWFSVDSPLTFTLQFEGILSGWHVLFNNGLLISYINILKMFGRILWFNVVYTFLHCYLG